MKHGVLWIIRGPVGLVIGSEGSGVSRLVKEKADFTVTLPMVGHINSLNASVACGVLCYEIARQKTRNQSKLKYFVRHMFVTYLC